MKKASATMAAGSSIRRIAFRGMAILVILLIAALIKEGASEGIRVWNLHQALVQMHEEGERQAPIHGNGFVTPMGTEVRLLTFTYVFDVAPSMTVNDLASGEKTVRASVCASKLRSFIRAGATMAYDYRNAQGHTMYRFAISCC